MARLFGTDGVRGLANAEITPELALSLGLAAARWLGDNPPARGGKPRAVIGRDTRISGEFLSAAIAAGLASGGVDVTRVGIVPTPAVAHFTATSDVDLGVMISASHNPMQDNGIKFFARGGYKLDDAVEDQIEALLTQSWQRPTGGGVGDIHRDTERADHNYVSHLVGAVGPQRLKGLRIAVDCANGAASNVAPMALREAGADVVVMNASPDGENINKACGSTHPEQLQAVTVASGADFGVAYDGDADRCLAVDAQGTLVDGDQIMGLLALALKDEGRLAHDTLVTTVMSNLGLQLAMREAGITTVQTAVGDRYVLEEMLRGGYSLGGEQSGHIIASQFATTGDGVLTSLLLAARVQDTGSSLQDLASIVRRLPQTLINVPNVDKARAGDNEVLAEAIERAEAFLGDSGRVLLRPSGTEPLVRVMVEARTQEEADAVAQRLASVVREQLAL
ncbi:phosphoglucosamine mutase [Buchananella hordeovulneris]|uniref:Phosphoglucosamine mutase n=1 Tax=Buchananella hordeovulneris TaxID=52770 RepID=A0A1Q5PZA7_9ACTO|nr:phosphoglucosamine mutase [Buchananella hordeovulneris]MDO5080214.1 phosphoglucosamine mutase [Buchananella hordeovulneris]OKL52759.1 phosphoglucosamine mutase [Buchananella hordeovulneris]RRD51988.1 phosphoglucosamine mutase [Buchananella hordeovulneris]